MAIAPTGAIYKALTFDGTSSRSYGVYITGEAVYNAPERDVKMVTIPGRNGTFALDNGRFENIEVTYPAGIFADTETDFAEAISDFRNFLCSRNGYVRLTDEYNPNEYRMAVYKSGLEVTMAQLKAGEFDITFECKPQRYLTSGESAVSVTSGNTITNPTLFDAQPLIVADGYGEILINGESIKIENVPYGKILVKEPRTAWSAQTHFRIDTSRLNNNDVIILSLNCSAYYTKKSDYTIVSVQRTSGTGYIAPSGTERTVSGSQPLYYGNSSTFTQSFGYRIAYAYNGSYYADNLTLDATVAYDGDDTITITMTNYSSGTAFNSANTKQIYWGPIYADSTMYSGLVAYIDLELGEAYTIVSDTVSSMNNVITIPPELPVLSPGSNTITYDNTITSLTITPRWWKV